MAARKYSQIWRADGLPYDCSALLPLPEPVGGVLVVSDNALLWVNHSANFGLGLNGDARTTATSLRAAPPGTCVSLRGASAALLGRSPLRVLLSLAGGELLQLSNPHPNPHPLPHPNPNLT